MQMSAIACLENLLHLMNSKLTHSSTKNGVAAITFVHSAQHFQANITSTRSVE